MPDDLNNHIVHTINNAREQTSPTAKTIARKQRRAVFLDEQGGIDLLKSDVLFMEEAEGGEPLISVKPRVNLSKAYLPPPLSELVAEEYGLLSQPRPDHAIGYVPFSEAKVAGVQAPFEPAEELVFSSLCTQLPFPFLTVQWKIQKGSQGHYHARLQGARDGATVVNYLHQFYTKAENREPSVIATYHFSATCDMEILQIYVHWREANSDSSVSYFMKPIAQTFLRKTSEMEEARKVLRNILEYSVKDRLQNIRQAIPPLKSRKLEQRHCVSAASESVTQAHPIPTIGAGPVFPPPTPSSKGSPSAHAQKKRKRNNATD
ncbi:hypothetical protein AOQ84DRAFT_305522 [Glonium stellatum]|uniref:DUF7924 domain-containing protein n=1 Tax=Glonium stellatum TaxID=574774 RepID=A0A8E2ENP3_9PEZI|nr:hypothetical protein AOQ84DRAFT_305522 [Glonium stellatum]